MRRTLLVSIALCLSACGGSSSSGSNSTTPEAPRRARVLRADVTAPAMPAFEAVLRDDSLLIVRGGRRLVLRESEVRTAALDFASPVVGLAEREDAFLYLTADGTLYKTDDATALGRPVSIGSTSLARLSTLGASRGRLVVMAGDMVGDLYSSDGGEFVKADLPARSVLGATFSDATHGCVLLFDGTARYSDDGGQTFRVVPGLARAFALDLHHGACRFHGGTEEEPTFQTIDERGRGVDYEPADDSEREGVYPYRAAELYLSRGTMARVGRTRAVAIGPEPTTVQVFALDDGHRIATHENALPPACTLIDVGDVAVAVCTPEEGDKTAWITRNGDEWTPLVGLERTLGIAGAQVFGSDDGQLAWTGPCNDDPSIASEDDTICVLRDTSTGAHVSVMISEHGTSAIRGLAGQYLLLDVTTADRFWVAKLGTDEAFDVSVPDARRILDVELASDGTLVVLVEQDAGVRAVYLGTPGTELVRRALPEGAIDASFQNAEQGVAAGRTMRDVFRTRDGGQTWTPMRISLEGDPSRTQLLDPERFLECHRGYCLGLSWRGGRGRSVVVRPMDEDETPATLAATGPDRLGDEPSTGLVLPTALRCELVDGTTTLERPTPAPARVRATRVYGDGRYYAWVDETARGARTVSQVHWRGTDADGAYSGSSRVADSNAARGVTVRIDVVSAGRQGVLANICTQQGETRECKFAIIPPGGVPLLLEGSEPHTTSHGRMISTYSVRELFFVVAPEQTGPKVYLFDPASGASSAFAIGEHVQGAFAGIAETALGPYFVLTDPGARLWQAIVEQEQGVSFPPFAAITDSRIGACRGGARSATARWPGHLVLRIGDETIEGNGFAEIALSDGPACISGYGLSTDPVFGRVEANDEGRFVGFVEHGSEGLRNVRCRLP